VSKGWGERVNGLILDAGGDTVPGKSGEAVFLVISKASSQIQVGDWFALSQGFMGPFCFDDPHGGEPSAVKYGVSIGVQALAAADMVSHHLLHGRPIPRMPGPLTAQEILSFLREVFDRHGLPRVGVLLAPSVWMSSAEMLLDDDLAQRAEFLRRLDIQIGPMERRHKETITVSLGHLGLRTEFEEDRLR